MRDLEEEEELLCPWPEVASGWHQSIPITFMTVYLYAPSQETEGSLFTGHYIKCHLLPFLSFMYFPSVKRESGKQELSGLHCLLRSALLCFAKNSIALCRKEIGVKMGSREGMWQLFHSVPQTLDKASSDLRMKRIVAHVQKPIFNAPHPLFLIAHSCLSASLLPYTSYMLFLMDDNL